MAFTEAAARSMHLNPNAGVKREIATLSRALKKADSAADQKTPAHSRRRTKAAKVKRQRGSLQHEKPPRRRRRSAVND
ncbi:putative phage terminase, endonuclease small subunit M [Escherichia coli P0304777.8]|nr:putative phage terminase, endonuclease small subunit M [Escherichia coli P0304777.8]